MSLYLATVGTGLIAGFFAGLVSYLIYRKYEESHELIKRLVYRSFGIPEEYETFKKRTYLLLMSFTGLLYGFLFQALRMWRFLMGLEIYLQILTFFTSSIGFSVAFFQILLHAKMKKTSKKVGEQWLIIGAVFGFFLGLIFNLVAFFLIGPLML